MFLIQKNYKSLHYTVRNFYRKYNLLSLEDFIINNSNYYEFLKKYLLKIIFYTYSFYRMHNILINKLVFNHYGQIY